MIVKKKWKTTFLEMKWTAGHYEKLMSNANIFIKYVLLCTHPTYKQTLISSDALNMALRLHRKTTRISLMRNRCIYELLFMRQATCVCSQTACILLLIIPFSSLAVCCFSIICIFYWPYIFFVYFPLDLHSHLTVEILACSHTDVYLHLE